MFDNSFQKLMEILGKFLWNGGKTVKNFFFNSKEI